MKRKHFFIMIAFVLTIAFSAVFYACSGSGPGGGSGTTVPGYQNTSIIGSAS